MRDRSVKEYIKALDGADKSDAGMASVQQFLDEINELRRTDPQKYKAIINGEKAGSGIDMKEYEKEGVLITGWDEHLWGDKP